MTQARRASLAAFFALAGIAACRFWLADTLPLMDTTEARFAEIARKMVETGDWIVPQHDYGVPYLAKPPLAFWLSAAGIEAIGAGELGPRILILGGTIAFVALLFFWARAELGAERAAAAVLILSSTLLFFAAAAAAMTDMVLTVCVSSALLAFWRRLNGGTKAWETASFVALGLGLLAKGPIVAVLVGAPLAVCAVASPGIRAALARLNVWRGAALAAAIAVPWYLAAEIRNPGFLRYFIVGEHIERFLVPGWAGDLYGRAHEAPRGTVWLFLVIGALPWTPLFVAAWIRDRNGLRERWRRHRDVVVFLVACAAAPLALFTLSRNVVFPYALPALPFAVPAVVLLTGDAAYWRRWLPRVAFVALAAAASYALLVAASGSFLARQGQRSTIATIRAIDPDGSAAIEYWRRRYFSADYYSGGRARVVASGASVDEAPGGDFVIVVSPRDELPREVAARLELVGEEAGMRLYAPPSSHMARR